MRQAQRTTHRVFRPRDFARLFAAWFCLGWVASVIGPFDVTQGQQPQPNPPLDPDDVQPPAHNRPGDNWQWNKIMDALGGNQPAQTGDLVLDDILQIARQRGSVLDDAGLDDSELTFLPPNSAGAGDNTPGGAGKSDQAKQKNRPGKTEGPRAEAYRLRVAIAAEQLLKSARLLEAVAKDAPTAGLVSQMRKRAGRLLVESGKQTQ